jgi:hypothetical protein
VNPKDIKFSTVQDEFGETREEVGIGSTGVVYKASMHVRTEQMAETTQQTDAAVKMMDLVHLHTSLKAD